MGILPTSLPIIFVITDHPGQFPGIEGSQDFLGQLMHPIFFLSLLLLRGFEQGLELAETHHVHQFMGYNIEEQREQTEVRARLQGLEDIVVLETDAVEIEKRGLQDPVPVAAVVFGHQGQGVGRDLLLFQALQGDDIITGPAPAVERQLKKVGSHLFGDDCRVPENFLMMLEEKRVAHSSLTF
jgi:hypothetical protein